ncbi:unnamed protein product, partial [Mesorhabditis spiculigera]
MPKPVEAQPEASPKRAVDNFASFRGSGGHNMGSSSTGTCVAVGDEVEDQNHLFDRIQTKVERNDVVVRC